MDKTSKPNKVDAIGTRPRTRNGAVAGEFRLETFYKRKEGRKMRFLSNIYDPSRKDARMFVACRFDETPEEAWQHLQEWLQGKVIGRPQASEVYSVEQLEGMGYVGVYAS